MSSIRASVPAACAAALALLALTLPAGRAAAAPRVDAPAPVFAVVDTSGKTHRLADYAGRVVVLEWTNHDCPYVKKHYDSGNMQSLQEFAKERDVVWLTVISSAPGKQGHVSAAKADELTSTRAATPAAVLLDESGDAGRAYDAKTTPHMYVIDADGKLRYMGGIDSLATADVADVPKAEPYFRDALVAVLDGKPVAKSATRPYGCSVKY